MSDQSPMHNPAPSLLPEEFTFSQSSLQAYEECPRRFWLAYVQQLPWPALEAAPALEYEQHLRWGSVFHKLVERAEMGLDVAGDELPDPLIDWWRAYTQHRPQDLDLGRRKVEFILSTTIPLAADPRMQPPIDPGDASAVLQPTQDRRLVRLAAKYDLVSFIENGPVIIVDWKTGPRRTRPEVLLGKWQTWLYPFILAEAGAYLGYGPIAPEDIELRYWFTAEPDNPVVFRYSPGRHAQTRARLESTLASILAGTSQSDFPKVPDTEPNRLRFCRYCIYRSRCDRGIYAGPLDATADDALQSALDDGQPEPNFDFTLDDVGELAF